MKARPPVIKRRLITNRAHPADINDQSWNATNYAGLVACNEQLGTNIEYVENVKSSDYESTFREYAEENMVWSWRPERNSMSRLLPSLEPDDVLCPTVQSRRQ